MKTRLTLRIINTNGRNIEYIITDPKKEYMSTILDLIYTIMSNVFSEKEFKSILRSEAILGLDVDIDKTGVR